jgi:hypothetical protein
MKELMPVGAKPALPLQSINKKDYKMNQEVVKEAYELPRISVRGIVMEAGIAEAVSVLTAGTITQENDWGTEATVKPTEEDASGYFWMGF